MLLLLFLKNEWAVLSLFFPLKVYTLSTEKSSGMLWKTRQPNMNYSHYFLKVKSRLLCDKKANILKKNHGFHRNLYSFFWLAGCEKDYMGARVSRSLPTVT